MARIISVASIAALLVAGVFSSPVAGLNTYAHSGHVHVARRGFGYGGYGYGIGFPFASSFTNALNTNFNAANYNDDTLYINNKDANTVNSNLNTFNNANIIF